MLAGDLKEFTLPDLFQLLGLTKKSGALRIERDGIEGRIYFQEGEVYFALADDRRLPIVARLVGSGHLSTERLQALLRDHRGGSAVEVAADLASSGEIDEAKLGDIVREQVHDALFSLLRLETGRFEFEAEAGTEWAGVRFAGGDALEEAHRRLDEWARLSEHMPTAGSVLTLVPNPPGESALALTREQWQLIALVDGKRTVGELIELSGKGEFAAGKLIGELVEVGVLEAHERAGQGALADLLAGRHALRQLEEVALGAEHSASSPAGQSSPPQADGADPDTGGERSASLKGEVAQFAPAQPADVAESHGLAAGRRPSWLGADDDTPAATVSPVVEGRRPSDGPVTDADETGDAGGASSQAVEDAPAERDKAAADGGQGEGAGDGAAAEVAVDGDAEGQDTGEAGAAAPASAATEADPDVGAAEGADDADPVGEQDADESSTAEAPARGSDDAEAGGEARSEDAGAQGSDAGGAGQGDTGEGGSDDAAGAGSADAGEAGPDEAGEGGSVDAGEQGSDAGGPGPADAGQQGGDAAGPADDGQAAAPAAEETPSPVRTLDRAQVARELASLGLDDDPPRAPRPAASARGEAAAGEGAAASANGSAGQRLTRDEEINRGLLLRLIDGVKGA